MVPGSIGFWCNEAGEKCALGWRSWRLHLGGRTSEHVTWKTGRLPRNFQEETWWKQVASEMKEMKVQRQEIAVGLSWRYLRLLQGPAPPPCSLKLGLEKPSENRTAWVFLIFLKDLDGFRWKEVLTAKLFLSMEGLRHLWLKKFRFRDLYSMIYFYIFTYGSTIRKYPMIFLLDYPYDMFKFQPFQIEICCHLSSPGCRFEQRRIRAFCCIWQRFGCHGPRRLWFVAWCLWNPNNISLKVKLFVPKLQKNRT